MKRNHFIPIAIGILFLLFSSYACNNDESKPSAKTEDDINVATEFIRSALDGKFDQARTYLLPDSVNMQYMDAAERNFQKSDQDTKNGYHEATIRIHQVNNLIKDSLTIIIFSNSFKNDHDTLKVLKTKGQWLIDLKYLYEHDMDTTHIINNRDSLK
jgi:hypothetical protein